MSAVILRFPSGGMRPPPRSASSAPFTAPWCEQHLPLVDAAMDLISADDAEFERRVRLMADADGQTMLDQLCGQLERLGAHVSDVADTLGLTALRIRDAVSGQRGAPA